MKKIYSLIALLMAAMTMAAQDVVIDLSAQGYENAEDVTLVEKDGVTVTFDKGTNKNNAPKYYDNGTAVRIYAGNTMTVAAEMPIATIEFTFASGDGDNALLVEEGAFEGTTWTGEANAVTFSVDGTKGHRRVQKLAITYANAPLYVATGKSVGDYGPEGDLRVECFEDYFIIRAFDGVEGYDLKVGFDQDKEITSLDILNGSDIYDLTDQSDGSWRPTGRNGLVAFFHPDYCSAYSDANSEYGFVEFQGYTQTPWAWVTYNVTWGTPPAEPMSLGDLKSLESDEGYIDEVTFKVDNAKVTFALYDDMWEIFYAFIEDETGAMQIMDYSDYPGIETGATISGVITAGYYDAGMSLDNLSLEGCEFGHTDVSQGKKLNSMEEFADADNLYRLVTIENCEATPIWNDEENFGLVIGDNVMVVDWFEVLPWTYEFPENIASITGLLLTLDGWGEPITLIVPRSADDIVGTTTAISNATATTDGAAYNIAGQKVNNSFRGIVLKNGKKYLQK